MDIDRSLFLRGNRALGQAFVQAGLLTQQNLDLANVRLIDCVRAGELKGNGLLPILTHEMDVLSETQLLQYQVSECGIGLIDLHSYQVRPGAGIDASACWATWTMPVDEREGVHFMASAYYLSQPARSYWEQLLGGEMIWYAASLKVLIETFERLESQPARSAGK